MLCPKCGYALSAFDKECPRCALQTASPQQVAPPAPPPAAVPPGTPTSVRPPTLPNQIYGGQGPVRPAPPTSSNSSNVVKIVLIVVVCSILGIAVLTIGVLSFLGNKMRSEMAAANTVTTSTTSIAPQKTIPTPAQQTQTAPAEPASQAAPAVPADYLAAEREYSTTYMKWATRFKTASDNLEAQPISQSSFEVFAAKVNSIWDERLQNFNVPARFSSTDSLLGQGLIKMREGFNDFRMNNSDAGENLKEGQKMIAASMQEYADTLKALEQEAKANGVEF